MSTQLLPIYTLKLLIREGNGDWKNVFLQMEIRSVQDKGL